MISIARTLGAPDSVPAGKPATQGVQRIQAVAQASFDVGRNVHHVAEALER